MRTVVVGERPPELEALIQRRRQLGQDLYDEVWKGEYHLAPAPHGRHGRVDDQLGRVLGPLADRAGLRSSGPCNVGTADDYRVPDRAYFVGDEPRTFNPSAELVVEIVSPGAAMSGASAAAPPDAPAPDKADESREKFEFYFWAKIKEVLIVDPAARTVEWFARDKSSFRPANASGLLGISAAQLSKSIAWPQ
jgi:Uma2 family endonuclease